MNSSAAALVTQTYCKNQKRILAYLQKMSDEQLHWRPADGGHSNSIAWNAWHLARWADYLHACIPGMTPELTQRLPPGVEIWHAENYAARWGFDAAQLGFAETGMDMLDEDALRLAFPAKAELLHYVERAFASAQRSVQSIDDQQFDAAEQLQPMTEGIWDESSVGDAILSHLTHDYEHLGMMECLLGLQGQPGTASH